MTFPVLVESHEGRFSATLVGTSDVRAIAATRGEAIAALKAEIAQRVGHGELVSLEVDTVPVSSLAGKYASDPTLLEICEEAYRQRDAELRQ